MRSRRRLLGLLIAVVPVAVAGGCGGGSGHPAMSHDEASPSARTVDIQMRDIAYTPTAVSVYPGETVNFVFHNEGQAVHEAFIGDEMAQADHEAKMNAGGADMGDMHPEGEEILVQPGKMGMLTHTFDHPGTLLIGCHEPGHYQAGMKVALSVG
jgi:uncharacterized cupredoxin-like copper-binding protein